MAQRNGVLDLWRGIVLLTIFVNHIPGNGLEELTYRNFGFSDSAEAFVFLSGLSLALAYGPRLVEGGLFRVVRRCLGRALTLYQIHLSLTLAALAMFGAAFLLTGEVSLITSHGRALVFSDPLEAFPAMLLLGHQLGYFNILPAYVVLMLWAPLALALARRSLGLALGASVAIYAAARIFEIAPPSWPEADGWFLNPFAWQLVFTLGIVAGFLWRGRGPGYVPVLFGVSLAVLTVGAFVVTDGARFVPGLWEIAYQRLDVWKGDLGLVRVVHFLALAYVLSQLRLGAVLADTRIGRGLRQLGRYSLPVFVAGSFLSAMGQAAMTIAEHNASSPMLVGALYTLAGALGLVLLARFLEWKGSARASSTTSGTPSVPVSLSSPQLSSV